MRVCRLAFCLLATGVPLCAHADENLFGYVYGAETLPAGGNELYAWITQRNDKGEGTYRSTDVQFEYEHGWSDRFQTSVYLTGRSHHISGDALEDEETGLSIENDRGLDFDGAKVSFKWNLRSPYKDGFGLALYVEPEYSGIDKISGERVREVGIETKLILQKNFMDDQIVTAYNLTLEPEWEREDGKWEPELAVENTAGISYRFAPNWFAGVETRVHMEFPDYGAREHWAWFAGPTLHYGGRTFWGTLTWLPQIKGGPTDSDRSRRLHLEEHERSETRLKIGYNF
jgi:hypothetical protein